jgi:hypothetical protein
VAETDPTRGRDPQTGRFLPGNKQGGRTAGLAAYVRQQTKDGRDLVDFYMRVFRGVEEEKVDLKYRMEAAGWLSDRGFGRPVQAVLSAEVETVKGYQLVSPDDWPD